MNEDSPQKRTDALFQLKTAQKMISDGRAELTVDQEKVKCAQDLIDQSADILRQTRPHRRN